MAKMPAFQFYPGDWKKDPLLSMCSPSTRGVWMDLLCSMHELGTGELRGNAEQLSRSARCSEQELVGALSELASTGAGDVTEERGVYCIMSRRMQRDVKERERWRYSKRDSRVPDLSRECPGVSSVSTSTSNSSSSAPVEAEKPKTKPPAEWVARANAEAVRCKAKRPAAYAATVLAAWVKAGGPPEINTEPATRSEAVHTCSSCLRQKQMRLGQPAHLYGCACGGTYSAKSAG